MQRGEQSPARDNLFLHCVINKKQVTGVACRGKAAYGITERALR